VNKLENIIAYLCLNYPHKNELSKARLTKLVYLADWFSSLLTQRQMTNIQWVFNHYGPYVDDVVNEVSRNENFNIQYTTTKFGGDKYLISLSHDIEIFLDDREKEILDFVINKTKDMYFDEFIDYIYATYPVTSNERYSILNLPALAQQYINNKSNL